MSHKLSLRQYKRLLGVQNEEQLAALLTEFEALDSSSELSDQAKTALKGMRQYLSQVDEAYTQADRDLALGKLSLELSSDELHQANQTLRQEAESRQQVLTTLRRTTNEVLSQLGKRLADEDSLEELSNVLAGLVSELFSIILCFMLFIFYEFVWWIELFDYTDVQNLFICIILLSAFF